MMRSTTLALLAAMLGTAALQAQDANPRDPNAPLFQSDEMITLTLAAPFKTLFDDRDEDAPALPATITYEGPDGQAVTVDLEIELRGKTRRQKRTCNFPPIRLDFPRSEMDGTLFEDQNRLKLVTQCQSGRDDYQQYVLLEYLIYRMYNQLTDISFRARLASITYEDTDGEEETITQHAFLIEDERAVAARHGWEAIEVPAVSPEFYDPDQLALMEVFQYMIGHTDFSAFGAAPDEDDCCHNNKVVGDLSSFVYPVPYDFDFAGLINARYAEVNQSLGIRRVTQRVYRGICRDQQDLLMVLQTFNQKQQDMYAVLQAQAGLEEDRLEDAIEYLDEFYETINDPGDLRNKIERRCRG